jgi:ABC-type transporter Mla subunit MlaD
MTQIVRSETSDAAIALARLRPAASDAAIGVKTVIDRLSGASASEIERVIAELSGVRDRLRSEAERVQRELAGFVSLNQAVMTSMKAIADSLEQWKSQTR